MSFIITFSLKFKYHLWPASGPKLHSLTKYYVRHKFHENKSALDDLQATYFINESPLSSLSSLNQMIIVHIRGKIKEKKGQTIKYLVNTIMLLEHLIFSY